MSSAGQGPGRLQEIPVDRSSSAKEIFSFDSLPQLLATSDLVVLATVDSIGVGRVEGDGHLEGPPPEGESEVEASGGLQLYDVDLNVERTLYGRDVPSTISIEEDGVLVSPWHVGDRGVYFIERDPISDHWRVLSSQGRYLVTDGQVVASNDHLAWAREVERLDLDGLIREIESARKQVEAGSVRPAADPRV